MLVVVFSPGLQPPPPWGQRAVVPSAASVPAHQHRHCPPSRPSASGNRDAEDTRSHAGLSASGHFWLKIRTERRAGCQAGSSPCLARALDALGITVPFAGVILVAIATSAGRHPSLAGVLLCLLAAV